MRHVVQELALQAGRLHEFRVRLLETRLALAQRFLLASTFLIAPLFLSRRLWVRTTISIFAAVTGVALLSLLVWDNFPHMFIDGVGLTPAKKALEL
ncbi:MAG: hypothetical protein E4H17_01835, partial [Gemmatimonadales bacterium]